MAFVSLNTNDLDVGDPVKKDIFDQVKDNEDNLNSRLTTVEAGSNKIFIFDYNSFNAHQWAPLNSALNGVSKFRVPYDMTLVSAIIALDGTSTSGTLEYDILKSSSIGGTFTSVFSTKPNLTITSPGLGTAGIFSTTSLSANDFLRFDITSLQVGQGKFYLQVLAEVS